MSMQNDEVHVLSPAAEGWMRPGDEWLVGSDARCDLRVADSGVLGLHCRLRHQGERIRLDALERLVSIGGAEVERAYFPLSGAFQLGATTVRLRSGGHDDHGCQSLLPGLIGETDCMKRLASTVGKIAPWPVSALVRGESGTGKELVARALHSLSPRAAGPFVPLSGAVLDGALGPSTLFGHARGAFTGASSAREGALRRAHGGTLFIDEVAALPPEVQASLLRVLEEGVFQPVGDDQLVAVDVRIVSATCEALEGLVERGLFRGDLYQRLAACVVRVPPLRERPEDIPALARHLLERCAPLPMDLTDAAAERLAQHRFLGNVRELRNVLCQAALGAREAVVDVEDVDAAFAERGGRLPRHRLSAPRAQAILARFDGNQSAAARWAGVPRSTFRDLLRRES